MRGYVPPREMLRELMEDNKHIAGRCEKAHELCDEHKDSGPRVCSKSFIDETERRTWFLFEASRQEGSTRHRAVAIALAHPARGRFSH